VGPRDDAVVPTDRNATLTTLSKSGGSVATGLWIDSISTGLELQLSTSQLQFGAVHRPVRLSEQYLDFQIVYSLKNHAAVEAFSDRIRDHWIQNLTVADWPTPMSLIYYSTGRVYLGMVEAADKGDTKFQSLYRRQYRMRLFNPHGMDANGNTQTGKVFGVEPFLPTSVGATPSGEWYEHYFNDPVPNPHQGQGGFHPQ
jgi:hypothetical protein